MEEQWMVICHEGNNKQWEEHVLLSEQDMCILLKMLLCQNLKHHEIIASVAGRLDLLEVRRDDRGGLWTPQHGVIHYTARRSPRP